MLIKLFILFGIISSRPVTLIIGGDLMPSGSLLEFIERDPIYPFKKIESIIKNTDIAFFNLECPIVDTGTPVSDKKFIFKLPTKFADVFKRIGIDGFTLANNHIMDYGPQGLTSTIRILDSLGIGHCGAGRDLQTARIPFVKRVNGIKIAFFGYSNTLPKSYWADSSKPGAVHGIEEVIYRDLKGSDADFKIMIFHWSSELLDTPRKYQRILAHYAIDHGADLVVGHHPHVIQPVEFYKGKPIFYSLGNFVFGSYSHNANGMLLLVKIFTPDSAAYFVIPLNTTYWTSKFQTTPSDSIELVKSISPSVIFIPQKFSTFKAWRVEPLKE